MQPIPHCSWATHWTGMIKALCGAIRIDGTAYRFMGVGGGAASKRHDLISSIA